MDMMALRRKVMTAGTAERDYLQGVEWTEGKFINASGVISSGGNTKYTTNQIVLPPGNYALTGSNALVTVTYRIHEYDANDNWISQLAYQSYSAGTTVNLAFTVPNNVHGIRLSISITFDGVLKKAT